MSNIEQFKSSFTITSEQFKSADMGQLKELTTNYADDGIKSYEWGYDGKPDSSGKLIHTIVGKLEYDFLGAYDKLQKLANSGDKIAMADLYDKWYDSTKISLRSKPTSLARLAIGIAKQNKRNEAKVAMLMSLTKMSEKDARKVIYAL